MSDQLFNLRLWSMLPPDHLEALLQAQDQIRNQRNKRFTSPNPAARYPASMQKRGAHQGPVQG